MKTQLFPKEFINSTLEHYTFRLRKSSQVIYLLLSGFIGISFGSLPFIYVNVSKGTSGIINTSSSKYQLVSPLGGVVVMNHLVENNHVNAGDTLIAFDTSTSEQELVQLEKRTQQFTLFIEDLEQLISNQMQSVRTERYKIERSQHQTNLQRLKLEIDRTRKIYDRQNQLHSQQVISAADFERDEANYQRALAEEKHYLKQIQNSWKEKSVLLKD